MPPSPLASLRAAVDAILVGQDAAKTGCLLALLARQHVHLEGPPGCGKSALAEGIATISGGRAIRVALHATPARDDLLGRTVLLRRITARGEQLSLRRERARLACAELLVLDDLARAPAEAWQPLLRAITERRLGNVPLPLECALATATAHDPAAAHEPMESAALDRFAVQVRMHGLVSGAAWRDARQLLDGPPPQQGVSVIDTQTRQRLQAQAAAVAIPDLVREALLGLAAQLAALRAADGAVLVSDRTLVAGALPLLRAHALLRGQGEASRLDLRALRFMLGRRVPETLLPLAEELVEEAARGAVWPGTPARTVSSDAAGEGGSGGTGASQDLAAPESRVAVPAVRARAPAAADTRALLRALEGRLEPGRADLRLDAGGSPRRQARLVRLDELDDADPLEALLFVDGSLPGSPRVLRRARRRAAGSLAVLRDVSASMEGGVGRATAQVATGLIRLGARRRMRMGYLEFHHEAQPFDAGGRFLHRRYGRLLALAARTRSEGRTSYEAPLRAALGAFGPPGRGSRHIVLLTDGLPVVGDPEVVRERALARRLGVRVHTVYMGSAAPPAILDRLARETGGLAFVLELGPGGRLRVRQRGVA